MTAAGLKKYRNGAKKMVAKGKTYGKKKGRDLIAIFSDLSISPSKPGTNAIRRVLAPTPSSQNEALLEANAELDGEQAAQATDQDDNKENRPSEPLVQAKAVPDGPRAAQATDRDDKRTVKNQTPTEISELTSLGFVESEVIDFQKFCKGWEKEVNLSKVGQGSYATVLKMELKIASGQYSVWKLMPLKPSKGSGSRPYQIQTVIKDAATEVKMLFAMSDIDGFVQFRSAHVVKGPVPDQINKAHESWAKNLDPRDTWYGTHLSAESSSKNQLWLLMEMTDAGRDINSMLCTARLERKLYSVHETSDMFWGIAEALMRGEAQAEFEHRDLHAGNVCIKIRDEPLDLTAENGIPRLSKHEVTLIDYTQSRLTLESGEVLATAIDESIFRQIDDDPDAQRQYDVYRIMRDLVKKEKKRGVTISQMWKEYVPMTNVLWLHHMLRELLAVTRRTSESQEELDMIMALIDLGVKLSPGFAEYHSAREVYTIYMMDRIRNALKQRRSPAYEPLDDDSDSNEPQRARKPRFSWLEYSIFLLLGVSMLWAWNMFLAASPYFQHRFRSSHALLSTFSPALISVSTVTNLVSMLLLTKLQKGANYPNRIILSLILNIVSFTLLALSTVLFRGVSPGTYFGFLQAIVFTASLATGFCQNGVFAYVAGFGMGEYTQAIMTGQAVAGVLPCIAQIVSVLSVAPPEYDDGSDGATVPQESGKSAFAYFLTATAVSVAALLAFLLLLRRHPDEAVDIKSPDRGSEAPEHASRKVVGLWTLFKKLRYLSSAVFLTFTVTMFFPVFTQQIISVRPADTAPRILQPACFIPLAFLFWNTGDLLGRLITAIPRLNLTLWPGTVLCMSLARFVFIPLYLLCNIHGKGAAIASDGFYLVVIQFLFGLSNGYLGSTCMMGAGEWVEVEEREAAGGFMGLMLVGGLTVGSLLSFLVA